MSDTQNVRKNSGFPPWIIAIIVILSLAVIGTASLLVYTIIAENKASASNEDDTSSRSSADVSSQNSSSDSSNDNSSDTSSGDTSSGDERKINPEYEKIYSDTGVAPTELSRVISAYDEYDIYAQNVNGGIIDEYQAGYEDGVVIEMYRYLCFSESYISAYYQKAVIDESDLEAFEQMMLESEFYATLLDRPNVTAKYEKSGLNWLVVQRIVDLDVYENHKTMFGTESPISRRDMQSTFEYNGYVNKFSE